MTHEEWMEELRYDARYSDMLDAMEEDDDEED